MFNLQLILAEPETDQFSHKVLLIINIGSGVTIGRARRAVHAGPALWGAQNLPDAVF